MNSTLSSAKSFSELARGFCAWVEEPSLLESKEVAAAVWLAQLHAAALRLPEIGVENEEDLPDIPYSAFAAAQCNLALFSGMYYRECFNPDPAVGDPPAAGDVGDDLLDVYLDVKRGLLVFERDQVAEALWNWSFLHRIHWGHHAVGALFALHCLPQAATG
jgi:hypothetical protein